jgi:hypothetical protein
MPVFMDRSGIGAVVDLDGRLWCSRSLIKAVNMKMIARFDCDEVELKITRRTGLTSARAVGHDGFSPVLIQKLQMKEV